jgi:phenylpyruvate tautomerase PptA (4-oxalocrotonate tautomerase family)
MLSAIAMTGCDTETPPTTATEQATAVTDSSTDDVETENAETLEVIEEITEQSTEPTVPTESATDIVINEVEEGTFEFVDETVTNPTVAPMETPDESATASAEVTPGSLAGTWKPLMAVSVADGKETPFGQIYGSSFREYGGSLVIAEDASFTISMGASITQNKGSGTFTMSQYNLLVTYLDGSVDTYLYIPKYQNHEVIKTQLNDYYVYFYKEA